MVFCLTTAVCAASKDPAPVLSLLRILQSWKYGYLFQRHRHLFNHVLTTCCEINTNTSQQVRVVVHVPSNYKAMVGYEESSMWRFSSVKELEQCRHYTNYQARQFLFDNANATATPATNIPVSSYACNDQDRDVATREDFSTKGPWNSPQGDPYLNAQEEACLIDFYLQKLPALIGPRAHVRRLTRDSKVLATAATLYRRFFTCNSVLLYDPKTILVAAAFLGSKVEDATADVKDLEQGTEAMAAPVSTLEIVNAEIHLLSGVGFYLLCFHPYKATVSLTEDLRTFLKTEAGQSVHPSHISGQDLVPVYEAARGLLDDVIVSDLPLVYSPGQIGLAALMMSPIDMDWHQYIQVRFPDQYAPWIMETLDTIKGMMKELKEGKHGCGNYSTDTSAVKAVHKKLKKVRTWGDKKKKSKKDKKRPANEETGGKSPDRKRAKTG